MRIAEADAVASQPKAGEAQGPVLRVEGLRTWIDAGEEPVRAVDGLSFEVRRGETFALLGESGCGKSITALSIMRLLPPGAHIVGGSVMLGGEDMLLLPEVAMRGVRGNRMAMIFQEPASSLNPVLTVGEQIEEVLARHMNLAGDAARKRALELLDAVGIPDAVRRYGEYPFQMSGGMKQRVMIATALAGEPDLLIADEPTTALDVTIQAQVLGLMRELQARTGMAMLLITHDLGVVAENAHRVGVMYAGQIVEQADREEFFSRPAHPYSRKLFASLPERAKRGQPLAVIRGGVPRLDQEFTGCRFTPRCDYAFEPCPGVVPGWTELDAGHGVRCHLYGRAGEAPATVNEAAARAEAAAAPAETSAPAGDGAPLLEVRDLRVHFPIHKGLFKRVAGHVKAVDGVSLDIRAGRALALVGESGCGKTTVGKAILQLIRPTSGSVNFEGTELTTLDAGRLRERRSQLQIVFQDPFASLNPRMRVAEIIEEGMGALGVGAGAGERSDNIERLLGQVGLAPEMKWRYPHEFSGGQRQRIAIARALAVNPKLIVCDEPTSALDVSVQAQILNLLKRLQHELGLAYLFITHNISVVEYLAQEVAVMYLGRVVERGAVEEVLRAPKHPYTQALLSAVPVVDQASRREVIRLQGDLPSPANPPAGCHFHPRCPHAMEQCRQTYPEATPFSATHTAHCHLYPEKG